MSLKAWPFLFLVSCAAAFPFQKPDRYIDCTTSCSLHVLTDAHKCAAAESTETRLMTALSKHTAITPDQLCAAENGWTVLAHQHTTADDENCEPGGWWQNGICVGGYTFDKFKIVETYDEDWTHNSLAHELIHVVSLYLWHKEGHCRWKEMGIKDAIKEVTGREDRTSPGENCK